MSQALMANEPLIRAAFFLGILAAMTLWEIASPRRRREIPRLLRWSGNLGIVVIDTILLRLVFPVAAVGLALLAEERDWGLLNVAGAPAWLAFVTSILVLDFAIYLQHVMFHVVPAFWRLHRMHHADLEFDATTGLRFHPVEILLSMGIKLAVIAALGPAAAAVLVFEVLLNATSLFNHATCASRRRWTGFCAGSSSPPTCTASTTRSVGMRRTATSASTCPGGTGCWGPTAPSPRTATRR